MESPEGKSVFYRFLHFGPLCGPPVEMTRAHILFIIGIILEISYFCSWQLVGNTTIGSSTLESQGSREIFVAKLDGQGNWQWAVQGGGIGCDEAYDIEVDNQGNAYITGIFWQNSSFGTIMLTSKGSFDIFIGLISSKNKPPDKPVIIGANNGSVGMEYTYNVSTIDPDSDDVFYHVKWGDSILPQIYGPYPSGEEVVLNHTWYKSGTYVIKAKAKDSNGAESDWATLEISMPKNKAINPFFLFLERLRERFPILGEDTTFLLNNKNLFFTLNLIGNCFN